MADFAPDTIHQNQPGPEPIKKSIATIRITNLALSAIIGANDWERNRKQGIVINIAVEFDALAAVHSDDLSDTLDYRSMKKRIIEQVNASEFHLVEKLVDHILDTIMSDSRVISALVRVDKPGALRFAESVSVEMSARRNEQ